MSNYFYKKEADSHNSTVGCASPRQVYDLVRVLNAAHDWT